MNRPGPPVERGGESLKISGKIYIIVYYKADSNYLLDRNHLKICRKSFAPVTMR
jgi:hypothetical protein